MLKWLKFDQGFEAQTFQLNFDPLKHFSLPKTLNPNQGGLFGPSIEWGGWNPPTRLYELVCPYFSSKSTKHEK